MKSSITIVLFVISSSLALAQTQTPVHLEKQKAELLRLHKTDREAHFKTDVDLLQQSSPEEFIAVSDGKIYRTDKAAERKHFEG